MQETEDLESETSTLVCLESEWSTFQYKLFMYHYFSRSTATTPIIKIK